MMEWHLLLAVVLALGVRSTVAACPPATVTLANGTVVGSTDSATNIQRFLGVPYAQPPVGDLRLRQAVSLNASFGTLQATMFGYSCHGRGPNGNSSEDCLTLNIWRPCGLPSAPLPVMVWLYGGGLAAGSASQPLFDGTNLVRISTEIGKPVLLVSLNYRLAGLGFLAARQMAELGLLNLGMLDQRLALAWVRDNARAFGGDPAKVTLFGESAGAVSIYSHMAAYGGRDDGLFRAAILQSGGAFPLSRPDAPAPQAAFDSLITNTNCASLAKANASEQLDCIRRLPIAEFRAKVGGTTGQYIDGGFSPTSIQFAFPAGKYVKVATMVGANTDEGTTSAPTGVNSASQLRGPLAAGYFRPEPLPQPTVDALLSIYPTDPRLGCPYNTGSTTLTAGALDKQACSIFGDLVQAAPARMIARSLTEHNGNLPVYHFRFNHLPTGSAASSKGIGTGVEQNYVFSNLLPNSPYDKALAYEMTSAWVSFAHDLDPNSGGVSTLPFWPVYGQNASSMVFNGFGSTIERDTYRSEGMEYIIKNVLPYGAR